MPSAIAPEAWWTQKRSLPSAPDAARAAWGSTRPSWCSSQRPIRQAAQYMGGMVSGLMTSVQAAASATLARVGMATSAATKVCMNGMMTPTPSPTATPRGTERWLRCQRLGWRSCLAKGRSSR